MSRLGDGGWSYPIKKISPQILFLDHSVLLSVDLHNSLCHSGVTCVFHFVQTKNLPFSVEEVRQMTKACRVCAVHKPQFH